jgi:hypothetical protein
MCLLKFSLDEFKEEDPLKDMPLRFVPLAGAI